MYVRKVHGEETSFGVSGALWRDALIFFDRKTGSYWSQINGKAIRGPLQGAELEEIPSLVTTWGEWKRLHPDTVVLRPSRDSRGGSPYAGYFNDPDRLGVLKTKNPDPRLPGKTLVLGLLEGGSAAAVPFDALAGGAVVQGEVAGTPIMAVAVASDGGYAYDRRVGGRTLDFRRRADGHLLDAQTDSVWEPESGRAVEGSFKGQALRRLDSKRIYWFVWAAFNPGTAILRGN